MRTFFVLSLILILSNQSFSQDTVAVRSISEAIENAKNGNFVSLGLLSDTETTFPKEFFSIPKENLIGLVIDNCNYTSIPDEVSDYVNLVYFRYSWFMFGDCPITEFPSFLAKGKSLRHIEIEGMPLGSVPSLNKLSSLESLLLVKCDLAEFPENVIEVTSLEELDLSCNSFKSIPEDIDKLTKVKSINFQGGACGSTPIENVPKSLSNLTKLVYFSYGNTEIREGEFSDFFATLPISK